MPIQSGDVYRVVWPYAVAVERDPYTLVLSEDRFNDRYVLVVPLFTENLAASPSRIALSEQVLRRPAMAHADKLTRLDALENLERDRGPMARIEEDSFFELHLAVGEAIGANFGVGGFEVRWKHPGKDVPERGAIWRTFWLDSKDAPRPGLVMSDWSRAEDHVILMPLTSQRFEERRRLPSCVDLGNCVAQADQVEVIRAPQLQSYGGCVDEKVFEAAFRAIAHVIGTEF
jgi:mRNA-degrading endonuclease toxin of MazEF toxin-antitoxin module